MDNRPTSEEANDFPDLPTDEADLASASRSCSAILIMIAALLLLLCVAFAVSQLT